MLLWVGASALAGALIALVARAAAYAVGYSVGGGTVLGEAALGMVALGGFLGAIGTAQWLILLRQVSWAGRWLLAHVAGGAIGGAVMLSLLAALTSVAGQPTAAVVSVPMGLAAFGLVLWLVLRGPVSWAGRLVGACVVGLIASAMLGGGVIGTLIGGEVGAGAGFGGVYGAITGGALVTLGSRDSASPSVAPERTT